jgi:hypothetical protein
MIVFGSYILSGPKRSLICVPCFLGSKDSSLLCFVPREISRMLRRHTHVSGAYMLQGAKICLLHLWIHWFKAISLLCLDPSFVIYVECKDTTLVYLEPICFRVQRYVTCIFGFTGLKLSLSYVWILRDIKFKDATLVYLEPLYYRV